ncbi:MAG: IS1 family transposase [Acidobacteria bacterium]|nr:IS1 family transposase [Acidobacteriota bacterium]
MNCPQCSGKTRRYGKDKLGNQRFRCDACPNTFIAEKKEIRIDRKTINLCIKLLVEGNSIRSTERIAEIHRDTILHILNVVGARCARLMEEKIVNIPVGYVEADEIWGFIQKKEGHKVTVEDLANPKIGDAYTFVAIEAKSKLVLCYHLGRRDFENAFVFAQKLQRATDGRFQLIKDGLKSYIEAIEQTFGADIDYAQLIKSHMSDETGNLERHYSPGDFVSAKKVTMAGNPDEEMISTSYVERQNLTMRMSMRRLTRLTNGFSKKWENLNMALALHFAHYNFCKIHQSLRVTPCMEAGITDHIWTLDELIGAL